MATTTINVNASFTGLSDTPASYSGQAGKAVFVKGDETGLEFGTAGGGDNLFTAPLTLGADRQHDMNGFGLTFLKSKFEFRASDGLSSGRAVGIRNHTNTGWLAEFRNDGSIGFNLAPSTTSLIRAFTNRRYTVELANNGVNGTGQIITAYGTGDTIALQLNAFNGTTNKAMLISNGDISFNTGNNYGTRIGSVNTEKFAFWGKTPIVQPTTAIAGATYVHNTSSAIHVDDTFGGYTIAQLFQAIINTGLIA